MKLDGTTPFSRRGIEVARAVELLSAGGIVAFPTETVYGLGADASSDAAVARIFAAKGRPPNHPLIVHVASGVALDDWAIEIPEVARRLAFALWPGPLTLILRNSARAAPAVTGGAATVGLRVPAHTIAQQLLRAFGGGIAAPSANRFGSVSPTTADHVVADLGDAVDYVLDGGACQVGVESTIVDLSRGRAVLLRPGGVPRAAIEEIAGPLEDADCEAPAAPGTLASHYAPRAQVVAAEPHEVAAAIASALACNARVAVLAPRSVIAAWTTPGVVLRRLPDDVDGMARELYAALRELDGIGIDVVVAALPPAAGLGEAVGDRLRRAAGPRRTLS